MQGNAAAVCCGLAPGAKEAGYGGGNVGVGLPGIATTIKPATRQGIAAKVAQALQAALHGANSVSGLGSQGRSGGSGSTIGTGAQVIPFPMVDPYSPIRRAGRPPVAGYTAFPAPQSNIQPARNKRIARVVFREVSEPGRRVSHFNTRGTEDAGPPAIERDLSGFGDLTEQIPSGISLEDPGFNGLGSLGETKLQTILGTIATTLPATVSAFKGQPYYPAQNLYGSQAQQGYTEYPRGVAPSTGGAGEGVGAGVGRAADTLGDTVSRFVTEHPYLVIGGGAALVLLFMNPPRRR